MLKVTSTNKIGFSRVHSVEPNRHGYIQLPQDPDAVSFEVFAPVHGLEEDGPWFLLRQYTRRQARDARWTVSAEYRVTDLQSFFPEDYMFSMPPPAPGQDHWLIGTGNKHCIIAKC